MQKLRFVNANGDEIDFTDFENFGVTSWDGLDKTDLDVQSQTSPFQDGSVFLDAVLQDRNLSFTVCINDKGNLEKRYELKRFMIHVLNPKLGEGTLYYTNDYLSMKIKAVPDVPSFPTKNLNNGGTLKAGVSFTACNPYWESLEPTAVTIKRGETMTLTNGGDVPAQLEISIGTLGIESPSIMNLTTKKRIDFPGKFDSPIVVSTKYGKKEAVTKSLAMKWLSGGHLEKICASSDKILIAGNVILTKDIFEGYDECNSQTWDMIIDVAYSPKLNLFCILGAEGYGDDEYFSMVSPDGINWTRKVLYSYYYPTHDTLLWVPEKNNFYAINGKATLISPDGLSWTEYRHENVESSDVVASWSAELGLFVMLPSQRDGTYQKGYTSPDGINWTEGVSVSYGFKSIIWCKALGMFVAVGYQGLYYSYDGTTWTKSDNNFTAVAVAYSNYLGMFVATGAGNFYKSTNGMEWEQIETDFQGEVVDMIYSATFNSFYGVGNAGLIAVSADGLEWNADKFYSPGNYSEGYFYDGASSPSCTVIPGNVNGKLLYSTDFENMEIIDSGLSLPIISCAYSNELNLFVAVGHDCSMKSTDGLAWERMPDVGSGTQKIKWFSDFHSFFAGGPSGRLYRCSDSSTWEELLGFNSVNDFCTDGNGTFFGVTGNTVFSTTDFDPEHITSVTLPADHTTQSATGIDYSPKLKKFALFRVTRQGSVIGSDIFSSPDGLNWTKYKSFDSGRLYDIRWIDGLNVFVAVGDRGRILISSDGSIWNPVPSSNAVYYHITLNYSEDEIILSGSRYLLKKNFFKDNVNIIDRTSSASDMNLNLSVGENKIFFTYENGTGDCDISFTEKYLGV